jgi:hypothetical protein
VSSSNDGRAKLASVAHLNSARNLLLNIGLCQLPLEGFQHKWNRFEKGKVSAQSRFVGLLVGSDSNRLLQAFLSGADSTISAVRATRILCTDLSDSTALRTKKIDVGRELCSAALVRSVIDNDSASSAGLRSVRRRCGCGSTRRKTELLALARRHSPCLTPTPIPSGGSVVRNMVATPEGKLYLACSGVNKVAIAEMRH